MLTEGFARTVRSSHPPDQGYAAREYGANARMVSRFLLAIQQRCATPGIRFVCTYAYRITSRLRHRFSPQEAHRSPYGHCTTSPRQRSNTMPERHNCRCPNTTTPRQPSPTGGDGQLMEPATTSRQPSAVIPRVSRTTVTPAASRHR
jgi:hypothetical protein